jgi:hypothetical protein
MRALRGPVSLVGPCPTPRPRACHKKKKSRTLGLTKKSNTRSLNKNVKRLKKSKSGKVTNFHKKSIAWENAQIKKIVFLDTL